MLYVAGTSLAFRTPWLGYLMFAAVALIWFVPDRRFSRRAP